MLTGFFARRFARRLVARADLERDLGHFREAAILYSEAARLRPDWAGIQVQCGHMYKEAGLLDEAEQHYLAAQRLTPDDPDLALQLGHFYKVDGRFDAAELSYRRALELKPGWAEPKEELANLHTDAQVMGQAVRSDLVEELDELVPELVPRDPKQLLHTYRELLDVRHLGRRENTRWGVVKTLRGIEAVRGFWLSATPITGVQILLDGRVIHEEALAAGLPLKNELRPTDLRKFVFNVWLDLSAVETGRYVLEIKPVSPEASKHLRGHRERVVILPPLPAGAHPESDSFVEAPRDDSRSVAERVNQLQSVVRPARRSFFAEKPKSILVLRTDQLGDLVASIPALRRLREMAGTARIVGLVTSANADLARTLGLFDEVLVADFPDDWRERRRTMPLDVQRRLRDQLAPYGFDLALDLAESGVSRPLLLLSGAKLTYGSYDRNWPWLSVGFEGNTHDPLNRLDNAPHSAKVQALVERLAPLFRGPAETIRRQDLARGLLGRFGLGETDRFVVLHTGARIKFSRWPHYPELASLILARTDCKVIVLSDEPDQRSAFEACASQAERFRFFSERLSFDEFDALLSFCAAFVGNDSGPKHLASLRGANVISLHSARTNWTEWGQEHSGLIISRRVPCAACMIYHDEEECGKDHVCVRGISVNEVLSALLPLLEGNGSAHD